MDKQRPPKFSLTIKYFKKFIYHHHRVKNIEKVHMTNLKVDDTPFQPPPLTFDDHGSILTVYSKVFARILESEDFACGPDVEIDDFLENRILPSEKEWRLQQYFYLVSLQKISEEDAESPKLSAPAPEPAEEWVPWNTSLSNKIPNAPPAVAVRTSPGPAWDVKQVLKAARLLCKPPRQTDFLDEQEMRRVYGLIYDVFRYKPILNQAIEDIDFLEDFPQYDKYRSLLWLFIMELARRRWMVRPRGEVEAANQALADAGAPFEEIEKVVWQQRVHFAAAIARMRIKMKAFALVDLLPPHLRDDVRTTCVDKETVTGWVNTFKAKKVAELVKILHDGGYSYSSSRQLCAGEYRFDRVCPRFITIRPLKNQTVGQIDPIKNGVIVLQEREFCEGASTLCRALRANDLQGVVAQTHASSPRSSAYLAAQLKELAAVLKAKTPPAPVTPGLGKLIVFGAGDRVKNYVCALRQLGVDATDAFHSEAPVCVLSDAVHCETAVVSSALERVVAVLAVPPNSYSSVVDPIDLVCGRGGDLAMLEILTESQTDNECQARVQSILEEQNKTLKVLLSKPQIQLVLYETHSSLEVENQVQVSRAVDEANRMAKEKHILIKKMKVITHRASTKSAREKSPKKYIPSEVTINEDKTNDRDENSNESRPESSFSAKSKVFTKTAENESVIRPATNKARPIPLMKSDSVIATEIQELDISVPNSDLFEISKLPNLSNGVDMSFILDRDGCYLSLIQRKEITRLDAKYMISVAEERGLFASNNEGICSKPSKKKEAEASSKKKRKRHSFKLERVAAPTYASVSRSRRNSAPATFEASDPDCQLTRVCSRHERRQAAAAAVGTYHTVCRCHADVRTLNHGIRIVLVYLTMVAFLDLLLRHPFRPTLFAIVTLMLGTLNSNPATDLIPTHQSAIIAPIATIRSSRADSPSHWQFMIYVSRQIIPSEPF